MTIEFVTLLLALGSVVGIAAGLLGIGGGLIVVPSLLLILPMVGITQQQAMPFAIGTSLATIILTSGSSAFNHFKLGNVDMFSVKWLIPGVISGGFLGSTLVELIPNQYLPKVFGVIVLLLAIQMFVSITVTESKPIPGPLFMIGSGTAIGAIASLAGIGGGALTVPYLNRYGVVMRRAVGTSSACGFMIAVSGMLGFVWHGSQLNDLPQYSLGYVYLPALILVSSTSIFTTRLGAKWASELPTAKLKKIFSLFLIFVAVNMLIR